jgi:hypothetical protein
MTSTGVPNEAWKEAIIALLKNFFSANGIQHSNYESIHDWLTRYFNFRLKFIPIQPWQLRVSKGLSRTLSFHAAKDACFDVFNRASRGLNLNCYQSKGLRNADVNDGMYNDWGIHHLHLSTTKAKASDFFVERSDYLLLVRFSESTAYFIDIFRHSQKQLWSLTDCIRILQTNWPEMMAEHEIPGRHWYPEFSDEEIGIMRKKGYTFGINVDDKSYLMLNHGYSCSGDNFQAVGLANEIIRWGYENRLSAVRESGLYERELMFQLGLSV